MTTLQTVTLTKQAIADLNARAEQLRKEGNTVSYALNQAAVEAGFVHVVKTSDDAEVYENNYGIRVNCWLEGPMSQEIQDGGAGFDDNTEWADETEDEA